MSKIREKFPSLTHEGRERKRAIADRPEYAAVPLNGWSAPDLDDPKQLYTVTSVDRLRENAAYAVQRMRQYDWVHPNMEGRLQELIERSVVDSQLQRIDRNVALVDRLSIQDDRFDRARLGVATPQDLLTMLFDHPELGSVELATMLTRPLDAMGSLEMDVDLISLIESTGTLDMQPAYYRAKSFEEIGERAPVMTVLRKQIMASYATDDGEVQVIRRQAFLVRGDEAARDELQLPYFDRSIRQNNPQQNRREKEVYPLIETFQPHLVELPGLKSIQPIASSYYAKNLKTVVNHRQGTKSVSRLGQ